MASTKAQPEITLINMDVDTFTQGGLADDFDGRAVKIRAVPWDYDGSIDHYILAVAVDFEPAEDSGLEPFTQMYSAGDLNAFVPVSADKTYVDLDNWEKGNEGGVYIGKAADGRKETMSASSNWALFLQALKDSGYEGKHNDLRLYEGVYGHWNRVPQKDRKGLEKQAGDSGRQKTILVMTEYNKKETEAGQGGKTASTVSGASKKTNGGAKAAASKPADTSTSTSTSAEADPDATVTQLIVAALEKRGVVTEGVGKVIPIASLSGALVASHGPKVASKEVRERAKDVDFLKAADGFFYDEDEGYVYLLEE